MSFPTHRKKFVISLVIVFLMVFSTFAVTSINQGINKNSVSETGFKGNTYEREILCNELGSRTNVPYKIVRTGNISNTSYEGKMNVMITFRLQNESRLESYLTELSDSSSKLYHRYMTRREFAENFSVSGRIYTMAIDYFSTFSNVKVRTYSDRISMMLCAPSNTIDSIFQTQIVENRSNGEINYFAVEMPSLPRLIEAQVSQISGLSNKPVAQTASLSHRLIGTDYSSAKNYVNGYPAPIVTSGVQYLYGSDLQVAYCTAPLYNVTYPTNTVVATILWAGNTSTGQKVGPFNPSNIYDYYNSTIPAGEPHSVLHGVPIGGAAYPGKSANDDTSGVTLENTLDLEMIGSLAPGSNIYNVYGPTPTEACLNAAFAYILNPNATEKGLNNVSVISNSWGTAEFNDTAWFEYLQEAQARGISVLASSGDSGDNSASSEYSANSNYTNDFLNFPASMAYDSFGITSVGGTTLELRGNLHIKSQSAWYEYEKLLTIPVDPIGSVGGISQVFSETAWQRDTEANDVIKGAGLGVPDIASMANNTLMCVTVNGAQSICSVAGTSVASPTEAGIIADINAVLNHYGQQNLGYLNPSIYKVANQEFFGNSSVKNLSYTTSSVDQVYLPLEPFYNVNHGGNALYRAVYGYNLVTGWGSINAYNFTEFMLDQDFKNNPVALSGVENVVNISSLNFTDQRSGKPVPGGRTVDIEQQYTVSDQLGDPIYHIHGILNLTLNSNSQWSGYILVEAEYSSYQSGSLFRNYEISGKLKLSLTSFPSYLELKSLLNSSNGMIGTFLTFGVNGTFIKIPLPGGAYIIGSENYSYIDPYSSLTVPEPPITVQNGVLDPEFGFVSPSAGESSVFSMKSDANTSFLLLPFGRSVFVKSSTHLLGINSYLSDGTVTNLEWMRTGYDQWFITNMNGSDNYGISAYLESYRVTLLESGLPSDQKWSAEIGNRSFYTERNSLTVSLINGTYKASPSTAGDQRGYPGNYSFTVYGKSLYSLPVEFETNANETLLNEIYTATPELKSYVRGSSVYNLNLSQPLLETGTDTAAIDSSLSRMYTIDFSTGTMNVLNLTTDRYYNSVQFGRNSEPYDIIYDNYTDHIYIFSMKTGNITFVNPSTMNIIMNVTVAQLEGKEALMEIMPETGDLLIFSNRSQFYEINGMSGAISNVFNGRNFEGYSPYYTYSGGNIYAVNSTAETVDKLSVSTGSVSYFHLPGNIRPLSIFNSGLDSMLLISGITGNNYQLISFNITDNSFSNGPDLTGIAIHASFDSLNRLDYIDTSGTAGEVWIINPTNLSLAGSAPYIIPDSDGMFPGITSFEERNQYIYAVEPGISSVYVYNVQHYYGITFRQTGLPSVSRWFLNVTGKTAGPISTSEYSRNLPNGTYIYSGYSNNVNYILFPYESVLVVNGRTEIANLSFYFSYLVTYNETGLPSGLPWYVNVTGLRPSGSITVDKFVIRIPNGTLSYSVASSNKIYAPYYHENKISVDGRQENVTVAFYLVTFNISFTEKGLSSGTKWSITEDGTETVYSITSGIIFSLPNGTYRFTLPNLQSYYNVIGNMSIRVNGKNLTEEIGYYHYAYISGNLLPANAILTINGKVIKSVNGAFNVSEEAGYFQLVVKANGYNSFHSDFSLRPGNSRNFEVKLTRVPSLTVYFYLEVYGTIGAIVAAMIIGSVYLAIRKR